MLQTRDQTADLGSRSVQLPNASEKSNSHHLNLLWIAIILVCMILGLASIGIADESSRRGGVYGEGLTFFFVGLLLIFVPAAVRVLMPKVKRQERLTLILLLGLALYLVKILGSPTAFTFIDEYIHIRNTQNILRTHHLFRSNPLLPTAAYYPGLAAVCASLVNLTGLSIFASGLIIIGAARILMSACLFFIAEKVTRSSIAAAGAGLIYAANPMFLFWSSSFSYEDLALPLAVFAVWWIAKTRRESRLTYIVSIMLILAVTVTHHISAFALTVLLSAWWLTERLSQRRPGKYGGVGAMALVAGSAFSVWFFLVARPAASYLLTENLLPALQELGSLLVGHAKPRHLYSGGAGAKAVPGWYMLAGFAAVGFLMLALPAAILRAWKAAFGRKRTRRRRPRRIYAPMIVVMGIAFAFPLSLLPRFTTYGGPVSSRSSEYIFAGLGCVLGLLAAQPIRSQRRKYKTAQVGLTKWLRVLATAGMVTVVMIGEVTIGTPYGQLLPESSHPTGYPWIIQADAIKASEWARVRLGANQRFAVSAVDSLALATYGEQDTVSEQSVWPIFLNENMNGAVIHTIRANKIRYLFVDWRMTKGLPLNPGDYYFSPWEPQSGHYTHPLPVGALRKFAATPCTRLIYNSGAIQIFDVTRIENGSCV